MKVIDAIKLRASTRDFLNKPVDKKTITAILEAARWAPSGCDTQPWHVAVLQNPVKTSLSEMIAKARHAGQKENPDYDYYPNEWFEPYKTRRKECGIALYNALDIKRDDVEKRKTVWEKNYAFFHAPVALIFYIDKRLAKGCWMDVAMFIQNVMLAALDFDLATCPQASLAEYPDIVREHLNISDDFHIVCGMAMGYPNKDAAVNTYRTARADVDDFTTWFGS